MAQNFRRYTSNDVGTFCCNIIYCWQLWYCSRNICCKCYSFCCSSICLY